MRTVLLGTVLLLTQSLIAGPPTIKIPEEVKASGEYATVMPETDAVSVIYIGLDEIEPFPSNFLKDSKSFILPVRGLKEGKYRFVAVAASKEGEQSKVNFTVIVGNLVSKPPPVDNPKTPPKKDVFFFLVVRPNGSISPELAQTMSNKGWDDLRSKGHKVKDLTIKEASNLGITLPEGTTIPCMIVLEEKDNKSIVRKQPFSVPSNERDIVALPEDLK